MSAAWYVIRTQSRAEYIAAAELHREGFEVFLPRIKAAGHRMGHDDAPLFPGYLFLRWEAGPEAWPSFRPAHRVLGWVAFNGEIPSLTDAMVSELRERVDAMNHEGGLWRRFQAGERVQVNSGNMHSLAEVVEDSKSPHARVKVLLNFMGRMISAQVPWETVQPIENHSESYLEDQSSARPRVPRRTRGKGRWVRGFEPRPAGVA